MVQRVSILVSTFNGAKYLSEQLDSLVAQTYKNKKIRVRDDGSTDESRQILAKYAEQYSCFRVEFGNYLGISQSFFSLLSLADKGSRYFAFCDQDDVWHADKIERAVTRLSGISSDTPAIYCSRLRYVGKDLSTLGESGMPRRGASFQNALVENVAIGCTMVMNRAARDLIAKSLPAQCVWHDWWCYLVVSAFGIVVYDEYPTIKYRLHGENNTGAAVSLWGQFRRRIRRFALKGREAFSIHAQAVEFAALFAGRLPASKLEILNRLVESKRSVFKRVGYALNPGVYRQSRLDGFLLRVFVILDRY